MHCNLCTVLEVNPKAQKKCSRTGSNSPESSWNLKTGFKSGAQPSLSRHKGLATPPHVSAPSHPMHAHQEGLGKGWISRCPGGTPGSRSAVSVTQHDPPLPSWSHPAEVWVGFFFFLFCFRSASFNLKALLQPPELTPGDLNLTPVYSWDAFEATGVI